MPKRRSNAPVRRTGGKRPTSAATDFRDLPRDRSMRAASSLAISTKRADVSPVAAANLRWTVRSVMPARSASDDTSKGTTMPSTVNIHRVFATSPEKVFRAFVEPDALASWLPPYAFLCTVHEFDTRAGGGHRMSFRNFTTGKSHSWRLSLVVLRKPSGSP